MELDYLVLAYNKVFDLLASTLDPTKQELKEVFTMACNTFAKLSNDQDFFQELKRRDIRFQEDSKFQTEYLRATNLKHLVENFLPLEKKMLIKVGISEAATADFVAQVQDMAKRLRVRSTNAQSVLVDVSKLRNEACSIAHTLAASLDHEKERQDTKTKLKWIGSGLLGLVVIVIDIGPIAIDFNLSEIGTELSQQIGGLLLK
jgi:hypothetical protein